MIKRKPIILLWVGLLAMLTSYSQTKSLPKFWERIEVGTNLIPMVDSLTLKFDNLQVKYFYGKDQCQAVRASLIIAKTDFYKAGASGFNITSRYNFEIGHTWYYRLNDKVKLYQAADIENFFSSNGKPLYNTFFACYSLGIKYQFYKNFSLELETRAKFGIDLIYPNIIYENGVPINKPHYEAFYHFLFMPIKFINLNYRF
ncbi:MAG TPA: hypothetical protein PKH79_09045 [Prolixibacteraceae bacterium]|nr:hypothetical protein [Prolixibacteraceae bacterium]HPS11710.1 hypothetical protein [Prolixibacteraceae bacterium]